MLELYTNYFILIFVKKQFGFIKKNKIESSWSSYQF